MAFERWCSRGCALAIALILGWTSGASAQQLASKISVRDQVTVTIVGTELATGPFMVDDSGAIDYPYLGPVQAAGLTARELGLAIAEQLVTAQVLVGRPLVTVELEQTLNKTVTVSGAVNTRGEFKFAGELTVFNALIRAGGAAPDAGDEVLLIRAPNREVVDSAGAAGEVDDGVVTLSRRQIERGEFATSVRVEDGDRIVVSRARQVFIDGHVNRPGGYTIDAGTTLRQALSLAGGASELGAVNRIRILRNGEEVDDVDLDTTVIHPGDTITVPKRFF
jgi:polysaccharide export outer membrane protein